MDNFLIIREDEVIRAEQAALMRVSKAECHTRILLGEGRAQVTLGSAV